MKDIVVIGSDHAGFCAKEHAKRWLILRGFNVLDVGVTNAKKRVDYPIYALKVSGLVKDNACLGVLACGSGTGMCIAANRIRGIRAASGYDVYSARMSREDNDSNILCLRGRNFPAKKYDAILNAFFGARPSREVRHVRRARQLDRIKT
jgi:ribose 5-phosphate isomerase B